MVEQFAVGLGATGLHAVPAHEFVDVLEARVLARIHHRALVARERHPGAFVRGAAQGSALDRCALRVHRVDFDHPAKAVRFVRRLLHIEARVAVLPGVKAFFAQAPALLVCIQRLACTEVKGPVFLARKVGAPGCAAAGAVVECAQHGAPGRVGGSAQQRVTGGRPAHSKGRVHGEAACKTRGSHHFPLLAIQLHFIDGQAVRVLRLLHLGGRHGHKAIGVQQAVVGVLVVERDQPVRGRTIEREEGHAVVVHAQLHGLLFGAVAGVLAEGWHAPRDAHRIAPGRQHLGHVARWHDQPVRLVRRHRGEAQTRSSAKAGATGQWLQQGAQSRHGADLQGLAPAGAQHVVDAGVGGAVAVLHGRKILAHRPPPVALWSADGAAKPVVTEELHVTCVHAHRWSSSRRGACRSVQRRRP